MSPSKSFPFAVKVRARGGSWPSPDSEITVLDGHDVVCGTAPGELALDLPPGLYAVQVQRAGVVEESVTRHSGPTALELSEPMRFSAVPAADTVTSHEYYQGPAMEWSLKPTTGPLGDGAGPMGGLFIFLRAPEAGTNTAPLGAPGLRIIDYDGLELAPIMRGTAEVDEAAGWLAFHAPVAAGEYALRYEPPETAPAPPREMAIAVFGGWQTQVFMTFTDGPRFASASVLMDRGGFSPFDHLPQAVDAALAGLQNNTDTLLAEDREMLVYGKFDNPMLGLIGAHTLLRPKDVDRGLIEKMLINLGHLLGRESPDVRALRLMHARRFEVPVAVQPFERPPLLRAGLEAVLEAAIERPELISPRGLLADIAPQRFVDSPWSTWRPVLGTSIGDTGPLMFDAPPPTPEWVTGYVEDSLLQAARKDQDFDVAKIAAQASLPVSSVADAYEQVRASMPAGPQRTLEMERMVTRARREAKALDLVASEVRRLFFEGSDGDRVRALGLMQGDPSIQDVDVVLEAVRNSRSAFEQYHALRLAKQMVPRLGDQQRKELASTIAQQRVPGGHVRPGSNRWHLGDLILADLRVGEEPMKS